MKKNALTYHIYTCKLKNNIESKSKRFKQTFANIFEIEKIKNCKLMRFQTPGAIGNSSYPCIVKTCQYKAIKVTTLFCTYKSWEKKKIIFFGQNFLVKECRRKELLATYLNNFFATANITRIITTINETTSPLPLQQSIQ
jgi:hypothetical protein